MQNIILLFGGKSAEHDISIITACQVKANLNKDRYKVYPIYITPQNKWFLADKQTEPKQFLEFDESVSTRVYLKNGENVLYKQGKLRDKAVCEIDAAVIACHGLNGEDGTLQGVLELCGIPYTSSAVASSALCMDKVFMKQIFEVNNFPVTKYVWFTKEDYINSKQKIIQDVKHELDFPVVVKPANLGSSIGISVSKNVSELSEAIEIALCYDQKILVEEAVLHLKEFSCAAFGMGKNITLSAIDQPVSWQEFFGFNEKYLSENIKAVKHKTDVIEKPLREEIKTLTRAAYKTMGCGGVVRIDFLYNEDTEELFINEINSIPGSFSHFMFKNLTFEALLDNLIENAIIRESKKKAYKFSYESPVLLNNFVSKK